MRILTRKKKRGQCTALLWFLKDSQNDCSSGFRKQKLLSNGFSFCEYFRYYRQFLVIDFEKNFSFETRVGI